MSDRGVEASSSPGGRASRTEGSYNIGVACADIPASRFPERPALVQEHGGRTISTTFAELAERSSAIAAHLLDLGIERGANVGVYATAGVQTAVAHLGVLKAGAVTVPLIPLLGDEAIVHRLTDADIGVVLVGPRERDRLASFKTSLPDVRDVVVFDDAERAGASTRRDFVPARTLASDPAIIIYSSGTTGRPKGALEPHGILLGRQTPMSMIHGPFQPHDVFWTPVDWMWIGSFIDSVLAPLTYGCTVFTYDRERFDGRDAVRRLREFRVTKAFIAPTALRMLMDVPEDEWRGHALTSVHTGGESLTADAAGWAHEVLGFAVDEIYGMTEASFLAGNAHRYYPVVQGSMGFPYPGQTLALRDAAGGTPPVGEAGEIVVDPSGPTMFLRYYGQPEATAERFDAGWYTTGDLACCDERGYLFYVGRKDDLIISAGHRIGPGEIEDALHRHSAVREAAVVGVPDATRGQRIKAFVELHARHEETDALTGELQDLVRTVVGRHAYPREVEYVADFPRTVTGKVQRNVLRERSDGLT